MRGKEISVRFKYIPSKYHEIKKILKIWNIVNVES